MLPACIPAFRNRSRAIHHAGESTDAPPRNFCPMCKSGAPHGHCHRGDLPSAAGGNEVGPGRLNTLHTCPPVCTALLAQGGCVPSMPTSGLGCSQPMWPADIHNGEGSRANSPVIQSTPIPHQTEGFILSELILGIKMLSVCRGGRGRGRNTPAELLCAGHCAPTVLHIHDSYTGPQGSISVRTVPHANQSSVNYC